MFQFSTYHKILRISSVVCACVLLFQAGLVSRATSTLATHTQLYLASAVRATTGTTPIEPTVNEKVLSWSEVSSSFDDDKNIVQDRSTFVLSGMLLIILLLIVLNYSLEFTRARSSSFKKFRSNTKITQNNISSFW